MRGLQRAAVAAALIALCAPRSSHAQAENQAAARVLFDDARQLMRSGDYAAACPKLEGASKLVTSAGILLNLADCYENTGRTASAWTEFGEAAAVAGRTSRPDDEAEARRRQAALAPKLARLTIRVAHAPADLVVKRDGAPLVVATLGIAIPVDPGTHEIRAEAPGREPWTRAVSVLAPGKTVTIDVPELRPAAAAVAVVTPAPAAPAPAVAPPKTPSMPAGPVPQVAARVHGSGQRTLGVILGSAGVVGMGASTVLALVAKSQYGTAQEEHGRARADDSAAALGRAGTATWVFVAGGALAATGVVLWLTAPSPSVPAQVGMNASGLLVRGRF